MKTAIKEADIWGLVAYGEETFENYTAHVTEETKGLDTGQILERFHDAAKGVIDTCDGQNRLLASRRVLWYLTALMSRQGLTLKDLA